jgi:hypothetical protein
MEPDAAVWFGVSPEDAASDEASLAAGATLPLVEGGWCSDGFSKMDRSGKRCPKGEFQRSWPKVGKGIPVPDRFRGARGSSGSAGGPSEEGRA